MKKHPIFSVSISIFALIFFLQVFSAIFSTEVNGVHFGKRRPRLSSPVKQAVALQHKFESIEDISVQTESGNGEKPFFKDHGFVQSILVKDDGGSSLQFQDATVASSPPPLFTLYRVFRI